MKTTNQSFIGNTHRLSHAPLMSEMEGSRGGDLDLYASPGTNFDSPLRFIFSHSLFLSRSSLSSLIGAMTDGHTFNNISLNGRGGLSWMRVPRSHQLSVKTRDGINYNFIGFREQDVTSLTSFFQSTLGKTPEEKQLSVTGCKWGEVDLNGNTLTFEVGGKQAFEVSLADVSHTQLQGKNDVLLEFHFDDTAGANETVSDSNRRRGARETR